MMCEYLLTPRRNFKKKKKNELGGHKTIWMFPKIEGKPPKWMVKIMVEKPYFLMDDLGDFPPIFGNTHIGP